MHFLAANLHSLSCQTIDEDQLEKIVAELLFFTEFVKWCATFVPSSDSFNMMMGLPVLQCRSVFQHALFSTLYETLFHIASSRSPLTDDASPPLSIGKFVDHISSVGLVHREKCIRTLFQIICHNVWSNGASKTTQKPNFDYLERICVHQYCQNIVNFEDCSCTNVCLHQLGDMSLLWYLDLLWTIVPEINAENDDESVNCVLSVLWLIQSCVDDKIEQKIPLMERTDFACASILTLMKFFTVY